MTHSNEFIEWLHAVERESCGLLLLVIGTRPTEMGRAAQSMFAAQVSPAAAARAMGA